MARIPWPEIQGFMKGLHEQYKIMSQFQNNVEIDMAMPCEMAEVLFIGPMTKV